MDIFRDLYQQLIIDHNKNHRNYHEMENARHRADGHNQLCGDEMTVFINEKDSQIDEISLPDQAVPYPKPQLP